MRPILSPAARRLWRDPETLQLGQATGRAAVLCGLDPVTRAALVLLDGTRDRDQVLAAAAAAGCPPSRTTQLLELLAGAGLLEDAAAGLGPLAALDRAERERLTADLASWALVRGDGGLPAAGHRADARVLVIGAGRVGAPLAGLLAAAGVGTVDVLDEVAGTPVDTGIGGSDLGDVGRSRGQVARERMLRCAPSTSAGPGLRADLVLLAPARPDQLEDALRLVPDGTPYLLAEVRETVGVVGPLVLPGRTACLHCLDLTRADLDPGWPVLAAQLSQPSRARTSCDGPLALSVAAQAAMQALALLDGTVDPAALGGTLELALPDWRWRRRSWPVHPHCGCSPPPRRREEAAAGSAEPDADDG